MVIMQMRCLIHVCFPSAAIEFVIGQQMVLCPMQKALSNKHFENCFLTLTPICQIET